MIYLSLILLLAGAALLCVEIYLPGFGVVGVTGIVMLIASAVITIVAVPFGAFVLLGEVLVLSAAIYKLYQYMKKHQLYGRLVLSETLNEEQNEIGGIDYFIGKEGVAKTSLRPFGVATFNGNDVDVCSSGKYIPENTRVKVTSVSGRKIFVVKSDAEAPSEN